MSDNLKKLIGCNIISNLLVLFLSGGFFQTVLLENCLSVKIVSILSSVTQLVQTASMILLSKRIDRTKNVIKAYSLSYFPAIPLVLFLILLSMQGKIMISIMFFILVSLCIVYNVFYSIHSILSYKVPYHIMDINNYGTFLSISGILAGVFSLAVSFILSYLQNRYDFALVMCCAYVFTLLLIGVFFPISYTMRNTESIGNGNIRTEAEKINFFKYKPFYSLLLPNLLRGFCAGIIGLAVTIGYSHNLLDSRSATVLVLIYNAATMLGYIVYRLIASMHKERFILLICSIFITICLPTMLLGNSTAIFIFFYGLASALLTIINATVPVIVTQIVSYEVIGQYTSWRLLINGLGIAVAGFLCTGMFSFLGGVCAMLISGLCQLICGIWYYIYK